MPITHPLALDNKTTFILGAGASKPFGLPLGNELKNILLGHLSSNDVKKNISELGFSSSLIDGFHEALAGTYHPTIDIFLENKTHFRDLGSYLIAYSLLPLEIHINLLPQRDWYGHLYNFFNFDQPLPVLKNFTFVSLNYDRSLEHFLLKNIEYNCSDYAIPFAETKLKDIRIIHAHGSLGSYPEIAYGTNPNTRGALQLAAEGIRIVSDKLENSDDFQNAKQAIDSANNIVFIGFGYDTATHQKLFEGIDVSSKRILGTIYQLNPEIREHLLSYFDDKLEFIDVSAKAELFINQILPTQSTSETN